MESNKKVLMYGGAFDPPHSGHRRLLESAIEEIRPDVTLVIPTGVSPHKKKSGTPYWCRFDMAGKTFSDLSDTVMISSLESKGRRNYTSQTMKAVRRMYPGCEIYLLIGSDMLISFQTWHLFRRILSWCTLLAGSREDASQSEFEEAAAKLEKLGGKVKMLRFKPLEISSTELRNGLREGKNMSAFLTESVIEYIRKRGLYQAK